MLTTSHKIHGLRSELASDRYQLNEWLDALNSLLSSSFIEHRALGRFIRKIELHLYIDEVPPLNSRKVDLIAFCEQAKETLAMALQRMDKVLSPIPTNGFKSVQLMIGCLGAYSQIVFEELGRECFNARYAMNQCLGNRCHNTYLEKWLTIAESWVYWAEIESRHFLRGKFILNANRHLEFMNKPQLFKPNRDDAKSYERIHGIPDLRFIRPFVTPVTCNFEDLQGYYITPNHVFWLDEIFHDPDTAYRDFIPDLNHIRKRFSF